MSPIVVWNSVFKSLDIGGLSATILFFGAKTENGCEDGTHNSAQNPNNHQTIPGKDLICLGFNHSNLKYIESRT